MDGSQIRGAVSNFGELARLRVVWPEFALDPARRQLRSRDEVIDEIIQRVVAEELRPESVDTEIVYVRRASGYLPAMQVSVVGPAGSAAFQFDVDLVR